MDGCDCKRPFHSKALCSFWNCVYPGSSSFDPWIYNKFLITSLKVNQFSICCLPILITFKDRGDDKKAGLEELGPICNALTLGMSDTTAFESLTLSVHSLLGIAPRSSAVPMMIVCSARCPILIILTSLDNACEMALCMLIPKRLSPCKIWLLDSKSQLQRPPTVKWSSCFGLMSLNRLGGIIKPTNPGRSQWLCDSIQLSSRPRRAESDACTSPSHQLPASPPRT